MKTIFENYSEFVNDHREDFNSPRGVARMLQDQSYFKSFSESLTEGMEEGSRTTVQSVLDRQREAVLEEAANVSASAFTHKH